MSDRITCPRCGGKLSKQKDKDTRGEYRRCLDCGYRYRG